MYTLFETERKLVEAVAQAYIALAYTHEMSVYCYYGLNEMLSGGEAFYQNYNFLENIMFNFGFMWTDIIMIVSAFTMGTEEDLAYYISFYVSDFFFRFIFKETNEGYCWLPWNECQDIVPAEVVVDTIITT